MKVFLKKKLLGNATRMEEYLGEEKLHHGGI